MYVTHKASHIVHIYLPTFHDIYLLSPLFVSIWNNNLCWNRNMNQNMPLNLCINLKKREENWFPKYVTQELLPVFASRYLRLTSSLQETAASPWAFLALQVYTPPSKLQGLRISSEQMP